MKVKEMDKENDYEIDPDSAYIECLSEVSARLFIRVLRMGGFNGRLIFHKVRKELVISLKDTENSRQPTNYVDIPTESESIISQTSADDNWKNVNLVGSLGFNPIKRELNTNCGKAVKLTQTEANLIGYLMSNLHRFTSRTELVENVLGYHPETCSNTIPTHVYRIRKKVKSILANTDIFASGKYGYMLALADRSTENFTLKE